MHVLVNPLHRRALFFSAIFMYYWLQCTNCINYTSLWCGDVIWSIGYHVFMQCILLTVLPCFISCKTHLYVHASHLAIILSLPKITMSHSHLCFQSDAVKLCFELVSNPAILWFLYCNIPQCHSIPHQHCNTEMKFHILFPKWWSSIYINERHNLLFNIALFTIANVVHRSLLYAVVFIWSSFFFSKVLCSISWILCCPLMCAAILLRDKPEDNEDFYHDPCLPCYAESWHVWFASLAKDCRLRNVNFHGIHRRLIHYHLLLPARSHEFLMHCPLCTCGDETFLLSWRFPLSKSQVSAIMVFF